MTAAEIRKLLDDNLTGRVDGTLDEDGLRNVFLAEIAAQFAEMNERTEDPAAREQLEIHSALIKKLLALGDSMANLLGKDPKREPFYESAAKQAIFLWKEARG